jgi:deoxyribodipyrimidine photo-lyase
LRGSERAQAKAAPELSAPFWSVDSDVIVPTKLIGKEQYAARTIRPKIHALLDEFLKPVHNPIAKVAWQKEFSSIDGSVLQKLPIDRSVQPVSTFIGGAREARRGNSTARLILSESRCWNEIAYRQAEFV